MSPHPYVLVCKSSESQFVENNIKFLNKFYGSKMYNLLSGRAVLK